MADQTRDDAKTDHENMTRRGEDVDSQGPEPGRHDTGSQGSTKRMAGTSTARDYSSIDPQKSVGDDEDRSPAG